MSRSDQERFTDIIDAVKRCEQYAPHLNSQDHSAMAYDAILRNLAVIGEAVRALSSQTRARNRGRSMGCHRRPTQRRGARVLPHQPRAHPRHRREPAHPAEGPTSEAMTQPIRRSGFPPPCKPRHFAACRPPYLRQERTRASERRSAPRRNPVRSTHRMRQDVPLTPAYRAGFISDRGTPR